MRYIVYFFSSVLWGRKVHCNLNKYFPRIYSVLICRIKNTFTGYAMRRCGSVSICRSFLSCNHTRPLKIKISFISRPKTQEWVTPPLFWICLLIINYYTSYLILVANAIKAHGPSLNLQLKIGVLLLVYISASVSVRWQMTDRLIRLPMHVRQTIKLMMDIT